MTNKRVQGAQGKYAGAWLTAMKFRGGTLWSAKLAQRYCTPGHALDGRCPLCGMPDGGTHIALACPALKGHYLNRHDTAVALLATEIMKGKKGNCLLVTDLGEERRAALPYHAEPRIPTWLLRNSPARPDILLIDGVEPNCKLEKDCAGLPKQNINAIHIVEVGWCTDSRWQAKWEEKAKQHVEGNGLTGDLTDRLSRRYGRESAAKKVHVHPVVLGVSGFALAKNIESLLAVGLEDAQAERLLAKLARLGMTSLHGIVKTRAVRTNTTDNGHDPP